MCLAIKLFCQARTICKRIIIMRHHRSSGDKTKHRNFNFQITHYTIQNFYSCVALIFILMPFVNSDTVQNINTKDHKTDPGYSSNGEFGRYDIHFHSNNDKKNGDPNSDVYYDLNGQSVDGQSSHDERLHFSKEDYSPDSSYGGNNPYVNKFYNSENSAYSNYDIYKKFYLNPSNPLPKSSAKFKVSSRLIQTRYGKLQGIVLSMDEYKFLRPIEVFLGVPYATPPVGSNRFSPTRTPSPWDGIRISDRPGPACPQRVPDLSDEGAALEKIPKGRLEYLKRLIPYLKNQSEDCLYMNIFAPLQMDEMKRALPVLVYVHGESFEWNAGNPYDGSVLAAYADLIVVTINFRLGLFGFLNANPTPHLKARVANYGLMDQIAALHWVQQNIGQFGGDAGNVTLVGHGAGAACINFLMISPTVMPGLFHRAVLLSGSALSSWAIVDDPVHYAVKLANHLNCTIPEDLAKDHEIIVDCLREAAIGDLLSAEIAAPNFLTAFGPSVDGVVIKTDYAKDFLTNLPASDLQNFAPLNNLNANFNALSKRSEGMGRKAFSNKYDLLFGVVTSEALAKFSAQDIQNGFEPERRDRILRTYVRNAYTYHLSEIFYTVVNEYTDWERTVEHPMNTRDATLAALSDAQFVAPLVQSGDLLGGARPPAHHDDEPPPPAPPTKAFFYVFDYQTKDGDYPQRMGSVHGEELPYLFGAPLVDGFGHFPKNYTKSEVALSESFMLYISNFARSGCGETYGFPVHLVEFASTCFASHDGGVFRTMMVPDANSTKCTGKPNPNEHFRPEVVLPASRERNKFRTISWDEYDSVHQKYLEIGMKPRMKNHFRAHQLSVWLRLVPELHRAGMEDVLTRHNLFRNHNDPELYEGVVRPDPLARSTPHDDTLRRHQSSANGSIYIDATSTTVETAVTTCMTLLPSGRETTPPTGNLTTDTIANLEAAGYAAYSTALSVTIAIGCSLLILNVLIFAGVYYQRDKSRTQNKHGQQQHYGEKHFETISAKHSHYHVDPSMAPSIVVDVERQNRLSKKNNTSTSNDPHMTLNFKGPIGCDGTMQVGSHKPSSPTLSLETAMLPQKFARNNSSFRMPPSVNYPQMSAYATLPKNASTMVNDLNRHKLPPNGSVSMHLSSDGGGSPSRGSVQHGTVRRGKPTSVHGPSVPQAAMNEMRV